MCKDTFFFRKLYNLITYILKNEIIYILLHIIILIMKGKRVIISFVCIGLFLIVSYIMLYNRWKHLWALEEAKPIYKIEHRLDDTLRVVMIGDSWSDMHHEAGLDSLLQGKLNNLTGCPVMVKSRGKGGEMSRGIYNLMFENDKYGTYQILSEGPDYCIVLAGINDAVNNRGIRNYLYHYRLILDFLLRNNIRPVVVEIPDVNLWTLYSHKSIKDLFSDYLKSIMIGCNLYSYHEYREALLYMLWDEDMVKDIVFIPMKEWNGDGEAINKDLFIEDQIHLNRKGYELLDSCIAIKIAEDQKSR